MSETLTTERNAFWDMESDLDGEGTVELEVRPGMDALINEIRQAAGRAPRQRAERPTVPCPKCNGTGRWFRGLECFKCSGTGQVKGLLQDEASVKRRQKAAERRSQQAAPTPAPAVLWPPLTVTEGRTGTLVLDAGQLVAKARDGQIWYAQGTPAELREAIRKQLTAD